MNRLPMSPAAAAILRCLVARAGTTRDRILLSEARSTDWRSLTFTGERHVMHLRVPAPGARNIVERMCAGLKDAELSVSGPIVADIGVAHASFEEDGSACLTIEALTVAAD